MNKTKSPYTLGGRTWAAVLIFGLFGQIAWVIENMYFNVFLYNTISGDTAMIAAMVSASAVTATVTTLVMGALSDKIGRRKAVLAVVVAPARDRPVHQIESPAGIELVVLIIGNGLRCGALFNDALVEEARKDCTGRFARADRSSRTARASHAVGRLGLVYRIL